MAPSGRNAFLPAGRQTDRQRDKKTNDFLHVLAHTLKKKENRQAIIAAFAKIQNKKKNIVVHLVVQLACNLVLFLRCEKYTRTYT